MFIVFFINKITLKMILKKLKIIIIIIIWVLITNYIYIIEVYDLVGRIYDRGSTK